MRYSLSGMFGNPNDELNQLLKKLNIKKTRSVMTKLTLFINPFTCSIWISAKINGVEERAVTEYNPFEYPTTSFFQLADREFKITANYTDGFDISVEDSEDGTAQPITIRFLK